MLHPKITRRGWISLLSTGFLTGCVSTPVRFQGTFLQPWRSHEALTPAEWQKRFRLARELGCDEIVVQWTALHGGQHPWTVPAPLIQQLFQLAQDEKMGLRVGLPYNEQWWSALGGSADQRQDFLNTEKNLCLEVMRTSMWSRLPAFTGWYLPYELDQYNWATAAQRGMLTPWLADLAQTALNHSRKPLSVSTFFSKLPTQGNLTLLWQDILAAANLRPMLQDGVGVAGMGNYAGLEPLRQMLKAKGVAFDLIVELFEQLSKDDEPFRAQAAPPERIKAQLQIARRYGADRVIAYALDPWAISDTDDSRRLLQTLRGQ